MVFTPGPWMVQHHPSRSFVFARTKLADVYSEAWGDASNQHANASLMAAAPDLIACLRWIVERDGECLGDHPDILAKFRAVLAKAEGQS